MWWCVYVHCCSLLNELSRFDLAWLENPRHRIHGNIGNIEGDNTLSATDKRYLLGVHKRQGEGKLPSDPSTIDKQYLVDIYGRYCWAISKSKFRGRCVRTLAFKIP